MVDKTNEQSYYITFSRVCKLLNTKTHLINKWASGLEVFSGNYSPVFNYILSTSECTPLNKKKTQMSSFLVN